MDVHAKYLAGLRRVIMSANTVRPWPSVTTSSPSKIALSALISLMSATLRSWWPCHSYPTVSAKNIGVSAKNIGPRTSC